MAGTSVTLTGHEPHSSVRALKIDRQYKILCAGPLKGQNLRQWLNKWELLYAEAKATGHSDTETGLIINHFINSLKQIDPTWAAISLYDLQLRRSRNEQTPTFMEILNLFRQLCAEYLIAGSTASSYTAILQGQTPGSSSTPNKKSKDPPPKHCVCGKPHWYTNCFYLIESIRPKGWHSDPKIVKKIDEALKDPKVKANVDKARKRKDPSEQALTPTAELHTEPQNPKNFAIKWRYSDPIIADKSTASSYSVLKANDYDIANCWILSSGSNIHVCNDPSRFNTTQSTISKDYLISGSTTYPIQAYGTVDITVTSPTGKGESITLNQVALIPRFLTNLVSFSRAKAGNIYWDTAKDTLYTVNKGKQDHFCQLRPHNGLWIVKYNAPPSTSVILASSAATNTSSELLGTPSSTAETTSSPASQRKAFKASP